MKSYAAPKIADYGDVQNLTGLFGTSTRQDVLVSTQGQIVETETGSFDACPTQAPAPGGTCSVQSP